MELQVLNLVNSAWNGFCLMGQVLNPLRKGLLASLRFILQGTYLVHDCNILIRVRQLGKKAGSIKWVIKKVRSEGKLLK